MMMGNYLLDSLLNFLISQEMSHRISLIRNVCPTPIRKNKTKRSAAHSHLKIR